MLSRDPGVRRHRGEARPVPADVAHPAKQGRQPVGLGEDELIAGETYLRALRDALQLVEAALGAGQLEPEAAAGSARPDPAAQERDLGARGEVHLQGYHRAFGSDRPWEETMPVPVYEMDVLPQTAR